MSKNKTPWLVMGGRKGEFAHCRNCGQGLGLTLPQNIAVVSAALNAFNQVHSDCTEPTHTEPAITTLGQWINSRDTGMSSMAIYSAYTGQPSDHGDWAAPFDCADFGRCHQFLTLFPGARAVAFPKLAAKSKTWAAYIPRWDDMTRMYEAENGAALYDLMQKLRA